MTDVHYKPEHWTKVKAEADYKTKPAIRVTVNDRAATRQAIITRVRRYKADFLERSSWGAHKTIVENGWENDWDYIGIAIHMAGRSYSCGPAVAQLQGIQEIHQRSRNWADIGYHYAISCSGEIYEGRDIRFKGSHVADFNSGNIGIVLLEDLSDPDEFFDAIGAMRSFMMKIGVRSKMHVPEAQKNGLKILIKSLQEFFFIKQLGGHREFPRQDMKGPRLCPGFHGMRLVNEIRVWSGLLKPSPI